MDNDLSKLLDLTKTKIESAYPRPISKNKAIYIQEKSMSLTFPSIDFNEMIFNASKTGSSQITTGAIYDNSKKNSEYLAVTFRMHTNIEKITLLNYHVQEKHPLTHKPVT